MKPLYGAARAAVVAKLNNDPYAPGWSERHNRIADFHIDDAGHRVCGCEICQAWCGPCAIIDTRFD